MDWKMAATGATACNITYIFWCVFHGTWHLSQQLGNPNIFRAAMVFTTFSIMSGFLCGMVVIWHIEEYNRARSLKGPTPSIHKTYGSTDEAAFQPAKVWPAAAEPSSVEDML
jgi:hypothetical protein